MSEFPSDNNQETEIKSLEEEISLNPELMAQLSPEAQNQLMLERLHDALQHKDQADQKRKSYEKGGIKSSSPVDRFDLTFQQKTIEIFTLLRYSSGLNDEVAQGLIALDKGRGDRGAEDVVAAISHFNENYHEPIAQAILRNAKDRKEAAHAIDVSRDFFHFLSVDTGKSLGYRVVDHGPGASTHMVRNEKDVFGHIFFNYKSAKKDLNGIFGENFSNFLPPYGWQRAYKNLANSGELKRLQEEVERTGQPVSSTVRDQYFGPWTLLQRTNAPKNSNGEELLRPADISASSHPEELLRPVEEREE